MNDEKLLDYINRLMNYNYKKLENIPIHRLYMVLNRTISIISQASTKKTMLRITKAIINTLIEERVMEET